MNSRHILLFFEAACLLAALVNARKLWSSNFRAFLLLLPVICLVEWGNYFKIFTIQKSNNWIFTLVVHPVELICFARVYYLFFENEKIKKRIVFLSGIVALFMLADVLFIQGIIYLNTYAYILLSCVLVYYAYLYFKQIIYVSAEIYLYKSAYYWLSLAVLLFFSGEAALFAFFEYFLKTNNFKAFIPTFLILSNVLNVIFYTLLSISFFCKKK